MFDLEGLIKNDIKVMMETEEIRKKITWVWADQHKPKENHFVFAIAIDGFPRTKTKGSMEILLHRPRTRNWGEANATP